MYSLHTLCWHAASIGGVVATAMALKSAQIKSWKAHLYSSVTRFDPDRGKPTNYVRPNGHKNSNAVPQSVVDTHLAEVGSL